MILVVPPPLVSAYKSGSLFIEEGRYELPFWVKYATVCIIPVYVATHPMVTRETNAWKDKKPTSRKKKTTIVRMGELDYRICEKKEEDFHIPYSFPCCSMTAKDKNMKS